jgi:hypothetical protein
LTLSIVSEGSTSRVMVLPVRVLTKICIVEVGVGGGAVLSFEIMTHMKKTRSVPGNGS